jgi:hypothetical protein
VSAGSVQVQLSSGGYSAGLQSYDTLCTFGHIAAQFLYWEDFEGLLQLTSLCFSTVTPFGAGGWGCGVGLGRNLTPSVPWDARPGWMVMSTAGATLKVVQKDDQA